ncbi:unnamed protein product [Chrysoparadoxa australica]
MVVLLGKVRNQRGQDKTLVKINGKTPTIDIVLESLNQMTLRLKSESGAEYSYYNGFFGPLAQMIWGAPTLDYAIEIISPVDARQINRFRQQVMVMITETPELYEAVTAPYIQGIVENGKSLKWIDNVIEKKKEVERVLCEGEGFLMNVDTKWKSHPDMFTVPRESWYQHESVRDLYCQVYFTGKDIRTIRDLRGKHIGMLEDIYSSCIKTIEEVYGVQAHELRVFMHYLPQFYHGHIHICRIHNDFGVQAERAHLLGDIIQNLEQKDTYYAERTIQYKLRVNDYLYRKMQEHENPDKEEAQLTETKQEEKK